MKITTVNDGLYTGAAQQVFSYALDADQVWYDLSAVFGEPFSGKKLTVGADGCRGIEWPEGKNPGGSSVGVCGANGDVIFVACA